MDLPAISNSLGTPAPISKDLGSIARPESAVLQVCGDGLRLDGKIQIKKEKLKPKSKSKPKMNQNDESLHQVAKCIQYFLTTQPQSTISFLVEHQTSFFLQVTLGRPPAMKLGYAWKCPPTEKQASLYATLASCTDHTWDSEPAGLPDRGPLNTAVADGTAIKQHLILDHFFV